MSDGLCWRSECRTGCYYPSTCTEKLTAYKPPFEWPCDRRDAHGPHPREVMHTQGSQHHRTVYYGPWVNGFQRSTYEPMCPGVMAHPATQIGGNYINERSD